MLLLHSYFKNGPSWISIDMHPEEWNGIEDAKDRWLGALFFYVGVLRMAMVSVFLLVSWHL
jgi:hypothetical protein